MSTAVLPKLGSRRWELSSVADKALKASVQFWFVVMVAGQFGFAFTVAAFYGLTAMRGNFQSWNERLSLSSWSAGKTMGNTALAAHILFAAVIMTAGALQLVPGVRKRFPAFHRWSGRLYLLAAFTQGLSGIYLVLSAARKFPSVWQLVALWGNALLIVLCAAMALRYAVGRDFATHRRWAIRLFLVTSGSWFFRVGFFLTVVLFGPIGFDPTTFSGPLPVFWGFAEYLLPLAVAEIYFRAQARPGALRRMATAGLLSVLTLGMGTGMFAVAMAVWVPQVKAGFDPRKPIAEPLAATIASRGIDAAVEQYRELKTAAPDTYNFDESQLNGLGYELLHANKFPEAIRIFQLNVEAYPKSSNVYDSLAEGYMDHGDKALAIANYQESLQLNPKNNNAVAMLQKLGAR